MGRHIIKAVLDNPETDLAAALERPDHPALGHDAGVLAGASAAGVVVSSDLERAVTACEVLIDFSVPQVVIPAARAASAASVNLVVGTTGLDTAARQALELAGQEVVVVASPNMSVGVNVVLDVLARVARMLGPEYDFEVFELHHRGKVDAPSGTALRMAETVARERGLDAGLCSRHGRSGALGPRPRDEIGVHAARGGDVVGDHTAIFAGGGERIEIIHRAHSRETFALGAVRAALWTRGRPPGVYGMNDVLAGDWGDGTD
jgi:4-hydroxy-tetrahydrodipicolinate reductase